MTPDKGSSHVEGPLSSSRAPSARDDEPSAPSTAARPLDLEELRALRTEVLVSDLDGVLRRFDPALWPELATFVHLDAPDVYRAILGNPILAEVTRGRATHAQWRHDAARRLEAAGAEASAAREAVDRWARTPARVDGDVLDLLRRARDAGIAVFVFTNGTDRVRSELTELGLDDVIGPAGTHLLNSAELGAAKPDEAAYRAAQRRIEDVLGRPVARDRVVFTDDSPSHVRAATAFGWHAVLHRR